MSLCFVFVLEAIAAVGTLVLLFLLMGTKYYDEVHSLFMERLALTSILLESQTSWASWGNIRK